MIKIIKDNVGVEGASVTLRGKIRRILSVQEQNYRGPVCWYEVDDDLDDIEVRVISVGTGWELPENLKYWQFIDTVQDNNGYVWHYYHEPFVTNNGYKDLFEEMFGSFSFGKKEK